MRSTDCQKTAKASRDFKMVPQVFELEMLEMQMPDIRYVLSVSHFSFHDSLIYLLELFSDSFPIQYSSTFFNAL